MTLTDVLTDFAYLSVLLLIGFELRKRITILQRFFIPTSLIAGTIGMFFSPSWLGEVSPVYIPFTSGIGQWSGVLVIVVCATMFLSLELNQVGRDGMACGVLATGLMLVKVVDPDNETTASTCISTSSTLGYAWQIPYMVVGSLMIFTMPTITTVISVALLLFFLIGGEILFGRKRKKASV